MNGKTQAEFVKLEGFSKSFPGQQALSNVSLELAAGEVHALVGHNGSGKSTLIKILAGYHQPDGPETSLSVHGLEIPQNHWADHFAFIHQDLALVPNLGITENLALGRGYRDSSPRRINWKAEHARARKLVARFDLNVDVRQPVRTLSPAERAVVAIVRALDRRDRGEQQGVLVLDEATAALPASEVAMLFKAVRQVTDDGGCVLFVSHRLDEVFEIADRVTVLREGKVVTTKETKQLTHNELVDLIVGRPVGEVLKPPPAFSEKVVLEAIGLEGGTVVSADITVRAGEIVGVAGLLGSGREDLPGLLFGAIPLESGRVRIGDRELSRITPAAAIRHGIALVPRDRPVQGCIPEFSVRENISLPRLKPLWRAGRLSRRREKAETREWIDRVNLLPADPERPMKKLSGGNQQKAVMAKWLRVEPKMLLLDEPTQGVDVGAKSAIYALVAEAARGGTGVLVCSAESEDLVKVCDRVLVFVDGKIAGEFSGDRLTEHSVSRMVLGLSDPAPEDSST